MDFDDYPENPDWLTEYYQDDYPTEENQDEEYLSGSPFNPYSFEEIFEHCIQPTVRDGLLHIGKLLVWCLIFRITTQTAKLPVWLSHLVSALTGLVALAHFFYLNVLYLVLLAFLSYASLYLGHNLIGGHRGVLVTASCIAFNTVCELLIASSVDWHQIRGAQMILTMKAISLGFDLDSAADQKAERERSESESKDQDASQESQERSSSKRRLRRNNKDVKDNKDDSQQNKKPAQNFDLETLPNVIAYYGYCLCPGNSIFGPWVQYKDYVRIYHEPKWNGAWFVKIFLSMVYGFLFLTISTCWNPWMIPDGIWIWWTAYRDAMSFRASHYFVSYISEASSVTCGIGCVEDGKEWNLKVTQPHDIEIPRSLTEVVKSWNIPMHTWLKNYCFKPARSLGILPAIMTTYFASTMLHGLNFQLGAVLLSLGAYTYVEHEFRSKLANIFNASISASKKDGFRHKEREFMVMLVNLGFGLLTCFNLAYLGVMFNQDNLMEEGYSWKHTLAKWSSLGFTSHWIMVLIFVLSRLI